MIYVGIDVAKDKHDCFITNSDGEVLFKAFTIANNLTGFTELYQKTGIYGWLSGNALYAAERKQGRRHGTDRVCMAGAILLFQNSTGEKDTKRIPPYPGGQGGSGSLVK